MLTYLIILFTVLPALELYILIKVGTAIGAGNAILIIILTGIIGGSLAKLQGFAALKKIQDSMNEGIMPSSELMDGLMILAGGILLLTPGFITDIFGLLLMIPVSRSLIKLWLKIKFEKMLKEGTAVHISGLKPSRRYNDIDIN